MNTIVIGDLHGKKEILNELLEDKDQAIVCIGDYLDSFDRSIEDQIELIDTVLSTCIDRDNFIALWGNHENSYMGDKYMASGWHPTVQSYVDGIKEDMNEHLGLYTIIGDFLLTHAGVSRTWLPKRYTTLEDIQNYLDNTEWDVISQVGYYRGGFFPCGGPLWCDTFAEFAPIEGVKQVFGHTASRPFKKRSGIVVDDFGNWNIDCLDRTREVLELNEEFATIRKF